MRRFLPVTLAVFLVWSGSPLFAQAGPPPDTAQVATLPPITITAEPGNRLARAEAIRRRILELLAENQRLATTLRSQNALVGRLQVRLDSLKRVEASRKVVLEALTDSIAATRARAREVEALILAAESRIPPG